MTLLTSWNYGTNLGSQQTSMLAAQEAGMGSSIGSSISSGLQTAAPFMAVFGAINSAIGSYYAAKSAQNQLKSQSMSYQFQRDMSLINAQQAETAAQGALFAGERAAGQVGMRYGQLRGKRRASAAARGLTLDEGSTAEIEASAEWAKQTDMNTVMANAVSAAWGYRTQGVNYQTQALMAGVSAENALTSAGTISPVTSAGTSLLNSARSISYGNKLSSLLASKTA